MKQRKTYDFSAIGNAIEQQMAARAAFVPEDSEIIRRATALVDFDLTAFSGTTQEMAFLRANSQETAEGRHSLRDDVRNRILKRWHARGLLEPLYNNYGYGREKSDPAQRVFGQVLRDEALNLSDLSSVELNALFRIKWWVDGLGYHDLPSNDTIRFVLNRRAILEKFARQTANFRGREPELRALDDYVFTSSFLRETMLNRPPLLVYGVGGIGKSTLISQFLMTRVPPSGPDALAFVYLDFDHLGLSISDPLSLLAAGVRQVVAQFPSTLLESTALEDFLQDLLATQRLRVAGSTNEGPRKKSGGTTARSWEYLVGQLTARYINRAEANGSWNKFRTILVVLDSFEEAQYRTGETEIRNFLQFLNGMTEELPNLRLIIVGRSDLVVSPFSFRKLEVGDFDEEAAKAYLEAVGVESSELCDLIVEKVGGNPLTLKLAAALAREEGVGKKVSLREFARQLAGERTRELLVRRNIEHIRDPEVRKLALPGMLLRRIDAEVIQHVLAPVCGLGEIDESKARELYEGLRRVTFLIEQRNGELHFRRDLRMALREDIYAEQKAQCLLLHRIAEYYYQEKDGPKFLAERYYHELQRTGKAYGNHDRVDWLKLRPFLEDALLELPAPAAAYLARQFGVTLTREIMDRAGQEENDFAMVRRMEEVTLEGAGGRAQMEEVWREVENRTDSNEILFIYNRQLLALRMGYFDRVLEDLTPRSRALLEGMDGYLSLLRSNYTGEYATGLTADLPLDFTAFIEDQVMEAGVLIIKLRALQGSTYDETFTRQFAEMAANFPEKKLAVDTTNWRPFAAMLWEDRHTAVPERMESFAETCYLIHDVYQDYRHDYEELVESIANADQDRLALVLQNETGKLLDDVVLPGAKSVVARDFIDYLLGFYEGSRDAIDDFLQRVRNEGPAAKGQSRGLEGPPQKGMDEQLRNVLWRVRDFMKKDRLDLAIGQLVGYAKTAGNEELLNRMQLLEGRYNREQNSKYLMTDDEATRGIHLIWLALEEEIRALEG